MKHGLTLLSVVFLAVAGSFAQTENLSLDEAVKLALDADVRLLPERTSLQIARLHQGSSELWRDPEARFETGLNADENSTDSALRFYVPNPWQAKAVSMEKASQTSVAEAEYRMAEVATAVEVFRLYRHFQCLEKEIELAVRLVEIKRLQVDFSEQRVAASMGTSSQVLLLRWELREAEDKVRKLRQEQTLVKNQLAACTGLSPESLHLPALDVSEQFVVKGPEQVVDSAIVGRPELHLLQAKLQETESRLKQARAEQIPWVSHFQTGYADRADEWSVEAAISIPLFSLAGSKKKIALAERAFRQTAVDVVKEAVAAQVRDALDAFNGAVSEWRAHQAEWDELAEATRLEIKKLRESAFAPDLRVTLEEQLIRAENRQLQTLRMVYSTQADLFSVTGFLPIQE